MGYEFDWGLPFRAPYLGRLGSGLALTALLTAGSMIGSLGLGWLLAAARLAAHAAPRALALVFIELFRGVPTVFWVLFFYFAAPQLLGATAARALNGWSGLALCAALVGLVAGNAAHVAEILRAGFLALPRTQAIAAHALGLHPLRVLVSVLWPQALRMSLPALGPRMVHNFHNTSLALVIAVPELTWQTQQIETETFRGFEALTIASLVFVVSSLAMSAGFKALERWGARWA